MSYDGICACSVATVVRLFGAKARFANARNSVQVECVCSQTASYNISLGHSFLNTTTSLKAKAEDEPASHLQSHVNKEKDKAKLKKKDDKVYRAPTKQLLGEIHTNTAVHIVHIGVL